MTETELSFETQAQRIADRGRDALVERLRSAYGDAAAAHRDVISLDDDHIERMVQAAADRADGLQWRRALADVAAEEFGVSSREALSHPALARAQALAGAPSYEQSLAELIARPVPPPAAAAADQGDASTDTDGTGDDADPQLFEPSSVTADDSDPTATLEHQGAVEIAKTWPPGEAPPWVSRASGHAADELESVEADDTVLELLPEPDPVDYNTEVYDVEAGFSEEQAPAAAAPAAAAPAAAPAAAAAAESASEPTADHAAAEPTADHAAAEPTADHAAAEPTTEPVADEASEHAGEPLVGELVPAQEPEPAQEPAPVIVVPAIHLGGVANLPTKREGLSVRLSADGLDIMRSEHDIIGRLIWAEIEALEVPNLRVRRRHRESRARMVVRTPHGDASFEVPGVSGDVLRERVQPLLRLYGHN